jgi:hypothetical protein
MADAHSGERTLPVAARSANTYVLSKSGTDSNAIPNARGGRCSSRLGRNSLYSISTPPQVLTENDRKPASRYSLNFDSESNLAPSLNKGCQIIQILANSVRNHSKLFYRGLCTIHPECWIAEPF